MGIYINGMEIPKEPGAHKIRLFVREDGTASIWGLEEFIPHEPLEVFPVPEHGQILRVLKTERECVSRDCDRNCGKCDLSLEQSEILTVYDTLVSMFSDPADKEEIE